MSIEHRRIVSVVGARPNFMKLAPVARALATRAVVDHVIVHTGQHYDLAMSRAFFGQLSIPAPAFDLGVGSGSHGHQTGLIMQRFEPICTSLAPDVVLVYGDVNSTVAAALVAAKLGIRVGHVEAGLRSGDWSMPEEINRVLTDRLSAFLFTPSREAGENLLRERLPSDRIQFVGNVMIDTLVHALPAARQLALCRALGVGEQEFVLVTLHRPSNVDDPLRLGELLSALETLAKHTSVLFPVHPRTRQRMVAAGLEQEYRIRLLDPLPYLEMLSLVADARLVITDSGGLQEETTFLGIPCLTLRSTTERPITCREGTNRLVEPRRDAVLAAARNSGRGRANPARSIERWDGCAGQRIVAALCDGADFC